jgi:hypothetical protein
MGTVRESQASAGLRATGTATLAELQALGLDSKRAARSGSRAWVNIRFVVTGRGQKHVVR